MHNEFSELCFRGISKNPLRSLMGLACHAGPLQQMSNMSWISQQNSMSTP